MGDAAVCSGVHRSVVFDWNPADAAWYRAPRAESWKSERMRSGRRLASTTTTQRRSQMPIARRGFIAGSYAGFQHFPMFAAYSMFYFAAASFSEMASRLDSPRTPRGFLCGDSPAFVSALHSLSPAEERQVDARVLRGRGRRRGCRLEYRRPLRSRQEQLVRSRPRGHGSGRLTKLELPRRARSPSRAGRSHYCFFVAICSRMSAAMPAAAGVM